MLKWIIPIMLILCTTVNGVQVQYSEDNSTWTNITSVDENDKEGYQINLDADKLYYIRAKNGTSDWYYTFQRTREGGMNQMEIALAIFSVLFIIIGLYLLFTRR
jgi:hypothetical protein